MYFIATVFPSILRIFAILPQIKNLAPSRQTPSRCRGADSRAVIDLIQRPRQKREQISHDPLAKAMGLQKDASIRMLHPSFCSGIIPFSRS